MCSRSRPSIADWKVGIRRRLLCKRKGNGVLMPEYETILSKLASNNLFRYTYYDLRPRDSDLVDLLDDHT